MSSGPACVKSESSLGLAPSLPVRSLGADKRSIAELQMGIIGRKKASRISEEGLYGVSRNGIYCLC